MERNKQIQIGLLALLAILLIANLFGGGFKSWLGKSEGDKIRAAAVGQTQNSGNIPGTNINATAMPAGASDVPTGPTTTIQYENNEYEFSTVDEGEIVKHIYKFKNTGDVPLVISNCKGSCGCTVPTWPKEPIPPGGSGEIKVEFNSKGKPGPQRKQVTVTANTTPTETFLVIKGDVRGKEQPAARGN
ncbi:MAG: DUF1573 domain-containing protein [Saprospiraceae bacterium]